MKDILIQFNIRIIQAKGGCIESSQNIKRKYIKKVKEMKSIIFGHDLERKKNLQFVF